MVAILLTGIVALVGYAAARVSIEAQTSASIRRMTRRRGNRQQGDTPSSTAAPEGASATGNGQGGDAADRPTAVEPGPAGVR